MKGTYIRPFPVVACLLLGMLSGTGFAQTLPSVPSPGYYWPEGTKRQYRILKDSTEVGTLEAVMEETVATAGRFVIKEKLKLTLPEIGKMTKISSESRLMLRPDGRFMQARLSVLSEGRTEKLIAEYDSAFNSVTGGIETEPQNFRTAYIQGPVFALDNFMLDQLEVILAMHELTVGQSVIVPIVLPQQVASAELEFQTSRKTFVRYGEYADSVWQVDILRPWRGKAYVDIGHRLVKFVDPSQELEIELVRDPFSEKPTGAKGTTDFLTTHINRLPLYGFFFLVTAFWLFLMARDGFHPGVSYLFFLIGGIIYPLIYSTQTPLLESYGRGVLLPALKSGFPISFLGLVPALILGLLQETMKLIPLLAIDRIKPQKGLKMLTLGAVVGAGFGFVEAGYLTGAIFQLRLLASVSLASQIFTILFHVVSGAALGYGIARRKTLQVWGTIVGAHALGSYLIVFVQNKMLTISSLAIILALYYLALLAVMLYRKRAYRIEIAPARRGRR